MSRKLWDTPTDGISRKAFDRAMDSHIRRYTILSNEVAELRRIVIRWERTLSKVLEQEEKEQDRA